MRTRRLFAAVVGSAMALSLAGAAFAFADNTYLHQTGTAIAPGDAVQDCTGAPALDPGEVAWHFILNQTDSSFAAQGHFEFASGPVEQTSDPHGSGRDWYVVTGQTTLNGAMTYTDGVTTGEFNLSHVCQAEVVGTTPPVVTPSPTLPPTSTIDETPAGPAGTNLGLVLGAILLIAGGLTAFAMRPRRSQG